MAVTGVFPYNCAADTRRAVDYISSQEEAAGARVIWLHKGGDMSVRSSRPEQFKRGIKPAGILQFSWKTPAECMDLQREIDRLSKTFDRVFLLFASAVKPEDLAAAPCLDDALVVASTEPGASWSAMGTIGKLCAWQPTLKQELLLMTSDDLSVAKRTYTAMQNIEMKSLPQPFPSLYGMCEIELR